MVDDFKPGDLVTYKANPNYRDAGKPFFDRIEIKGGGDAASAARAVFQTGEYDYAWNLQVEAQVLQASMKGGKGDLVTAPGSRRRADPASTWPTRTRRSTARRSSPKSKHPFLTDPKVRQAMALAIDRETMAKQLYGPTGERHRQRADDADRPRLEEHEDRVQPGEGQQDARRSRLQEGRRRHPRDARRRAHEGCSTRHRSTRCARRSRRWSRTAGRSSASRPSSSRSTRASSSAATPATRTPSATSTTDVQMFNATFDSAYPANYMKRFYSANPDRDFAQKSNNWAGKQFHEVVRRRLQQALRARAARSETRSRRTRSGRRPTTLS